MAEEHGVGDAAEERGAHDEPRRREPVVAADDAPRRRATATTPTAGAARSSSGGYDPGPATPALRRTAENPSDSSAADAIAAPATSRIAVAVPASLATTPATTPPTATAA